jgi:hypothetical protein
VPVCQQNNRDFVIWSEVSWSNVLAESYLQVLT